MAGLSPEHLLIVLVIALIVIGPGKLPEVGAAICKSVREFQKATGGMQGDLLGSLTGGAKPPPPAEAPQAQPPTQSYPPQPAYGAPVSYPSQPPTQSYPPQPPAQSYPPQPDAPESGRPPEAGTQSGA